MIGNELIMIWVREGFAISQPYPMLMGSRWSSPFGILDDIIQATAKRTAAGLFRAIFAIG